MPLSEILLQLFPTLPYKWHRALGLYDFFKEGRSLSNSVPPNDFHIDDFMGPNHTLQPFCVPDFIVNVLYMSCGKDTFLQNEDKWSRTKVMAKKPRFCQI